MDVRWTAMFLTIMQVGIVKCDPYHLHGMYGTFHSANFPQFYDNNQIRNWTIRSPVGFRVVLYFTEFDLEDSYYDGVVCAADYIEIFDGAPDSNRTSGRLCGNSRLYPDDGPEPYVYQFRSSSDLMTVRFASDFSNDLPGQPTPKGFQAVYKAEDIDECEELEQKYQTALFPEQVGKCDHQCNNYMGGYQCTCETGYVLAPDGYTCQGKCSNVFISSRAGVITSPGYPHNYPKQTDCDWTIQVDVGQRIQLDFLGVFEIEDYLTEDKCPYDWLKIVDGKFEKKICGTNQLPDTYVSTETILRLEFHSDMVKEMAGFQVSHRVQGVYCDPPVPPAHGRVTAAYGAERGRLPFESVVVFECELGYTMKGEHKITCLKDGSFDDDVPTCVRDT